MCIIAICNERQVSKTEFDRCFDANSDGVGVAWADGKNNYCIKGLMNTDVAWEIYKEINVFPHVIHFRKTSSGGTSMELTHPFIISPESPIFQTYHGDDNLVFHNGHFTDWKETMMSLAIATGNIPSGPISDTRIIAMLIARCGERILELIDGKFVILRPDKTVTNLGMWDEADGVLFSNNSYKPISHYDRGFYGVNGWNY